MEEVFQEPYLRVKAEIDLDAVCNNMIAAKNTLAKGTKLMFVIKADGYGHGAVPLAKAVDELDQSGGCGMETTYVDAYGVAIIEEGVQLRMAGITKPILLLSCSAIEQMPEIVSNDLTATVYEFQKAKILSEEAQRQGKTVKVHIKVDTGMGRIGYTPSENSIQEIVEIGNLPGLSLEGLFTHLACADEADKTSANRQFQLFSKFTEILLKKGIVFEVLHVANSSALIELSRMHLDMVRSGIMSYGLYPSKETMHHGLILQPVLSMRSHISYIKKVAAGEGISYGSTFITNGETLIATVPVGYADGYPRLLSSKGRVLVKGKSAPILGRICMDQFMVDVSKIPDVKAGDQVTLIGRDGEEFIPAEELADLTNTINYEITCNISKRVPRVYYRKKKAVSIMRYL